MSEKTQTVITAAKATPSVGAAGALLAGINLDVWVQIFALIYTLILIGERVWKWGLPQRFWRWGVGLWEEHRGRV